MFNNVIKTVREINKLAIQAFPDMGPVEKEFYPEFDKVVLSTIEGSYVLELFENYDAKDQRLLIAIRGNTLEEILEILQGV